MKKRIAIFSIILIVISLVLISLWMVSRQTAEKRGAEPMTFKQFITGQTRTSDGTENPDGVLTSDFINPETGTNNGNSTGSQTGEVNPDPNTVVPGTQSSTFTQSSPISVATDTNHSGTSSSSGSNTSSTGTPPNSGSNTSPTRTSSSLGSNTTPQNQTADNDPNPVPIPSTPTTQTPVCSQSDTQITFTPTEIARLRELERRFYATAEYLHTDEELAIETSNYDTFKLKTAKILEMYNYCQQKSPLLPDPLLHKRVATPFWIENDVDNSYLENALFLDLEDGADMVLTENRGVEILKRRFEPMFRINLW